MIDIVDCIRQHLMLVLSWNISADVRNELEAAISDIERMREAVAAEREACAKIVEAEGECRHVDHVQGFCACADKAAAIRARATP